MFTQLVMIAYHNRKAKTVVDQATLDTLLSYIQGKLQKHGTSWINVRAVYMLLRVSKNHWVTVKIDLEEYEFILFYCSLGANLDSFIQTVMEPLQLVIPYLLYKTGEFR